VIDDPAQRVRIAGGALDQLRHRVAAAGDVIGQAQGGRHPQRHRREQVGHRPQPRQQRVFSHGQPP